MTRHSKTRILVAKGKGREDIGRQAALSPMARKEEPHSRLLSKTGLRNVPGSPVTKTRLIPKAEGPVSTPAQGTRSHMLQLNPGAAK